MTISTYNNFHGISNVLGVRFSHVHDPERGTVFERHIEIPKDLTPEDAAKALEKLASHIRENIDKISKEFG